MKTSKSQNFTSFFKRLNWRRILIISLSIVTTFVVIVGSYFVWNVYQETDAFNADKLLSGEPSKIFNGGSDPFFTYNSDENGKRINVNYEQLPQVLIDAVIAGEDSRFFEHDGFDLPRIAKAAISNLVAGGITSGGSTITQQVIKKSYFSDEDKTYTRKISEIFLAMEATKQISKEEILTLYLNKIYFGRSMSSVGVAAASKYYFDKDVSQLTLPEAALLAGTLNSPNTYDPYYNLESATKRRNVILNLMVDHGYITQEECDNAKKVEVQNMLNQSSATSTTAYQAYVDTVNREVKEKTGLDPTEVQMNIYTYMDADIQTYLDDLTNGGGYKFPDEYMQVGASVQSTMDGRIVGIIAGRNNVAFGTNRAVNKQQPGSSLKPILDYGAAFEFLNWSTGHEVEDKTFTYNDGKTPKNWDGQLHGKMSITEALKQSWNLPAIWTFDAVLKEIGPDRVYEYLEKFGVDMTAQKEQGIGPAFAIGGWSEGISPIELASMYATIGNNGSHVEPHTIERIEIVKDGKIIYVDEDCQSAAKQAISAEAAFMIREVQSGYSYQDLGYGQLRAKTGTSNYGPETPKLNGSAKDSWLAAYNPDYSFAIWMGYDGKDVTEHSLTMDGPRQLEARKFAAELYKKLAENGVQNSFPNQPEGVINAQMVRGTFPYKSPSANTPGDRIISAWFKKGYGPSGLAEDLGINALDSFDASINGDGRINVNFSAYNPIEATTDSNTNEATQMYGLVKYAVEVTDAITNELLHTEILGTNSATLNYAPTGKVNVSGYYTYEGANNIRSNVRTKTIGNAQTLGAIQYSITSNNGSGNNFSLDSSNKATIKVSVTPQSSNSTITVSLLSSSGALLGERATLPNSAPGCTITIESAGNYQIRIDEGMNGQSANPVIVNITVAPYIP